MTSTSAAEPGARVTGSAYLAADTSVPLVDYTLGALLAQRAAEYPERDALIGVRHGSDDPERLTYAELLDEASRVAAELSRVAAPGSLIALWAPNVLEWTVVQYGAALAGMVLVALNPVLRHDDLDYALRHSRAEILLHADTSREYDMAAVATRVCGSIDGLHRISLSEIGSWRSADPLAEEAVADNPAAPVMLQYTSGTTGRPKGVLLTHRALVNVAKLTMEATGVQAGAVTFNPLPLFHTAGCVIATLGPLWVGGTSVLCQRFTPASALAEIRRERVSVFFYVPTVLDALLKQQAAGDEGATRLDIVMGGAANVPSELIDGAAETFGAEVFNLYGQTELAPVLSLTRPTDNRTERLSTVGRPLPQVDCKIIDPDTGRTLAVGEVGEICARGYQQFVEYLHDPDATFRALDPDGFVRTGDLGVLDERGYLKVTGRLKELIIRGGENIAPAEVEQVVMQHEDVSDVVALALPDARWGEVVAVACRLTDGPRPNLKASLVALARSRMPAYKVPARWFVVEEFPVTPTGKVQRFALRDAALRDELGEL